MKRIAFADESGLDGLSPCYAIGVVSFDHSCVTQFESYFTEKLVEHGVVGEAKWKKVTTSHGLINFGLNALDSILRSESGALDVIVVNTARFRNWNSQRMTREEAFYQTYTFLLSHIAERASLPAEIYIDDREDRYSKTNERMTTIGNNMLSNLASAGWLENVQKVRSHDRVGIQIADILTGAINSAHARWLSPQIPLHKGKVLAIERLAEMLGWSDLCYDTMPSHKLNIWHFPIEWRARPRTESIGSRRRPRYVSAVDLLRMQTVLQSEPVVVRRSA